jgi:hypothetical protein
MNDQRRDRPGGDGAWRKSTDGQLARIMSRQYRRATIRVSSTLDNLFHPTRRRGRKVSAARRRRGVCDTAMPDTLHSVSNTGKGEYLLSHTNKCHTISSLQR